MFPTRSSSYSLSSSCYHPPLSVSTAATRLVRNAVLQQYLTLPQVATPAPVPVYMIRPST